jgi:hypothetical protein
VIGATDPQALARFYAELLGWEIQREEQDWVTLRAPQGRARVSPSRPSRCTGGRCGRVTRRTSSMMMHVDIEVEDLQEASQVRALPRVPSSRTSSRRATPSCASTRTGTRSACGSPP